MLRSRRILLLAVAIAAGAVPAAAFLSDAASAQAERAAQASPQPDPAVEIGTATISHLGTVLVRGDGHAVYMFVPDTITKVACSGGCEKIWPLLLAPSGGTAKAIDGAKQSLIGSVEDPALGKRVVTYDGWPLYTYVLDRKRDQASGQDIAMSGGHWWVMTAAGKPVRKHVPRGIYVGS